MARSGGVAGAGRSTGTHRGATQRLARLIEEVLARCDENPPFVRRALVTQGAPSSGAAAVGAELALISLDIARLLRTLVDEGMASGQFRLIEPDLAVTLIGQQIYGAIAVRAAEPIPGPRAEAAAAAVDFLLHGLTA